MDTITHGLVGALIGKAFFAEAGGPFSDVGAGLAPPKTKEGAQHAAPLQAATARELQGLKPSENQRAGVAAKAATHSAQGMSRVAIWVATLGALFPDSDSIFDAFDTTGMAVITEHRGLTHSLLLLPLWTLALAGMTWWFLRRRENPKLPGLKSRMEETGYGGVDTPPYEGRYGAGAHVSFRRLALIWAASISSHILLDLTNSWGTMIWMPLERTRVVWDLTFVIDFSLTAIALAPQMAAWVYARKEGSVPRRMTAWMLFSLGAVGAERLARVTGFGFSPWVVGLVSVLAAGLFMVPQRGHWGFGVSRAAWCRAGCLALVAYLGLCAAAHQLALTRVEQFVGKQRLAVENAAAIPLPPSLLHWDGLIRTPQGVYEARFSLLDRQPPFFRFVADAEANSYIESARRDKGAQDFLWFARFPSVSYRKLGGTHFVEFKDLRFFSRPGRQNPFTFRVTLDAEGRVVNSGWVE